MKTVKMIIAIAIIVFGSSIALMAEDAIDNSLWCRELALRLTKEIEEYNTKNKDQFKSIILKHFSDKISEEELDSLIIVASPLYVFSKDNILLSQNSDVPKSQFNTYYLDSSKSRNIIIHDMKIHPLTFDSSQVSFRLYSASKELKYYIEICDGIELSFGSESSKQTILKFFYKTGGRFWAFDLKYSIDLPMFLLTNIMFTPLNFHHLCIYNQRIYSVTCLQEKYKGESLSAIFEKHINEIEDCEIDKYISSPR